MANQFALMSVQFAFPYDPLDWGSTLDVGSQEPDDWLHNPDPRRDRFAQYRNRLRPIAGRPIHSRAG